MRSAAALAAALALACYLLLAFNVCQCSLFFLLFIVLRRCWRCCYLIRLPT